MKIIFAVLVLLALLACDKATTKIDCYDSGKLVYHSENECCPEFAGTGYAKLESGTIIKGECVCRTLVGF